MSACPSIDSLQRADAEVVAHLAICPACQSMVALLNPAEDDPADCARAELLIAAGAGRPLEGRDAVFLPSHLSRCPACRQIALEPVVAAPAIGLPRVARDTYILGAEIGRGGMGRILSAYDRRIGRTVAIKEMLSSDPLALARFEREARITARLQHPGIVAIYEVARWLDDRPFYAMPILPGRTLREAIASAPTLGARLNLVPAVRAAAEAVAYAHSRRIIHRDLTPSNILLGSFGETIVIDWGVAKDLDQEAEPIQGPTAESSRSAIPLTVAGTVVGTLAYIPPEQAEGNAVDERADIYALGAILHHVLTGRHPYQGNEADMIVAQLRAGASPPFEAEGAVPRALVAVVTKAMAPDPTKRYRTAQELATDLRAYLSGGRKLLDYVAFGLRAMGRRRLLAGVTFLLALGLVSLVFHTLPRSYHLEVVLVEEEDSHLPPEPRSGTEPTRSLAEYALELLRRLNVRSLAREEDLLASWRASRAPLGRLADWIKAGRDQAFEAALEDRPLSAKIVKDGSRTWITLAVDWPDRPMAYRLLAAAKESFVEIHQGEAMTRVGRQLHPMVVRARNVRAELDRAFAVVEQLQLRREGRAQPPGPEPTAPGFGVATLLCIDQMTLADLNERRRILAALEGRLGAARASGDSKQISELTERLAGLGPESIERRRLREAVAANEKLLAQQGGPALPMTGREFERDDTTIYWCQEDLSYDKVRFRAAATGWDHDDRAMAVARAHLRTLLDSVDQLSDKVSDLEKRLLSMRAIFRAGVRHVVPHPPSAPTWPSRPSLTTRLAVSLPVALLLSLLVAVAADVRSRRRA